MIRQQSKNRSIFVVIMFLISIIPYIGAYMIYYFTRTRLGMYRHMVYVNPMIESTYNVNIIKIFIVGISILSVIYLVAKIVKSIKNKLIILDYIVVINIILGLYYIIRFNAEIHKGYYISSILIFIGVLFMNSWLYFVKKISK